MKIEVGKKYEDGTGDVYLIVADLYSFRRKGSNGERFISIDDNGDQCLFMEDGKYSDDPNSEYNLIKEHTPSQSLTLEVGKYYLDSEDMTWLIIADLNALGRRDRADGDCMAAIMPHRPEVRFYQKNGKSSHKANLIKETSKPSYHSLRTTDLHKILGI